MMKKISTTLGALAVAFTLNSCGNEEQKPVQPVQTIKHSLQTTPSGEYDKEFAEKVLELAKLAVTKPMGAYEVLEFKDDVGVKVNVVYVRFEKNGNRYFICVGDYDEKSLEDVVSIPEQSMADEIILEKISSENEKETRYSIVSNSGLNGNIFEGLTYVFDKIDENLPKKEGIDEELILPKDLKEYYWLVEYTENKSFFEQEFRNLVDELLAIYKSE